MTDDLRCDFPCDDDCEAECHQAHLPTHKRRPDMCGCATANPHPSGALMADDLREFDAQLAFEKNRVATLGADLDFLHRQHTAALAERDEWRQRAEHEEASTSRVAALHPSREEADAAEIALCLECVAPAPCKTRRALDGET